MSVSPVTGCRPRRHNTNPVLALDRFRPSVLSPLRKVTGYCFEDVRWCHESVDVVELTRDDCQVHVGFAKQLNQFQDGQGTQRSQWWAQLTPEISIAKAQGLPQIRGRNHSEELAEFAIADEEARVPACASLAP